MQLGSGRGRDYALVFAAAVLLPVWVLWLPFQLEDYSLLVEPLRLFDIADAYENEDIVPFMLRWPMWLAWAIAQLFAGDPRSPVAYHVFGLLLHGIVAVLIARVVNRRTPWAKGRAGLFAGLIFAAASGHLQAMSWTAAWSGMLYTLFGWLALDLFESARALPGKARWRLVLAGFSVWLALVSKAPGFVVLGPLVWVLGVTAWGDGRLRRYAKLELPTIGLALAAGLVSRFLFLGSFALRHYQDKASAEGDLARLPGGFAGLGQALYPWNADPLFCGEEPFLAWFGLSAIVVGWGGVGLVMAIVLGAGLTQRVRRGLLVAAIALVPCVVPLAMLYMGQANNVASRAAYIAVTVVAAILGMGLSGLGSKALAVSGGLLLVMFLDGGVHYARTELAAGREQDDFRDLVEALAVEHEATGTTAELVFLCFSPDPGFAGIPSLGPLLVPSLSAPWMSTPVRALVFRGSADLARSLGAEQLTRADLVTFGAEMDAAWLPIEARPGDSGATLRARRALRALHPVRAGLTPGGLQIEEYGEGWRALVPVPAHALGALRFEVDGASRGEFVGVGATSKFRLAAYSHNEDRATVRDLAVILDTPHLLGEPIQSFEWRGSGAAPRLTLLEFLPEVEVLKPREGEPLFADTNGIALPEWRARIASGERPTHARLEFVINLPGGIESVHYSDSTIPTQGDELVIAPRSLHLGGAAPPLEGVPWEVITTNMLLPSLLERRVRRMSFRWRIAFHAADGSVMARSRYFESRIELRE